MNHNERLDQETEKKVFEYSNMLLEFLEKTIPVTDYSHINMSLNVIIATLFRISDKFLTNMDDKKAFAIQIAKSLMLNYQANEKNESNICE